MSWRIGDIVKDLLEVEKGLRELAFEAQRRPVEEVERGLRDRLDALDWRLSDALSCALALEEEGLTVIDVGGLCEALRDAERALEYIRSGLSTAWGVDPRIDSHVEEALSRLEERVLKLVGTRCRYGGSKLSTRLNDLASCIHRVAEFLMRFVPERSVGRCDVAEGSSPEAVRFCLAWSEAASILENRGLYSPDDADSLWGYAVDSKVYLKVGYVEGHRTLVDLKKGVVEYYDEDEDVNQVMKRLLESLGLRCELGRNVVRCYGLSRENLVGVATALAFATSMDLRLANPGEYWGIAPSGNEESFEYRQCRSLLDELVEKVKQEVRKWLPP